jgi:myosin heavy subunit
LANDVVQKFRENYTDQSILCCGESGAGKTETLKYLLRFFAGSLEVPLQAETQPQKALRILERKILESNPIMESFGNASTRKNENSSRFGKFVELYFNAKFHVQSATIRQFLLEKSRAVKVPEAERNFHIFYQIFFADSQQFELELAGRAPQDFHFLEKTDFSPNDSENFQRTFDAMKIMGFTMEEISNIFKVLSGLLHLGNLSFHSLESKSGIEISPNSPISIAAFLLGLEPLQLWDALTTKSLKSPTGHLTIALTVDQSETARAGFAMLLYSRLFEYIITRLNQSLSATSTRSSPPKMIGLLDLYGFESFDKNGIEQ